MDSNSILVASVGMNHKEEDTGHHEMKTEE